jgi:N-acetyl-alpha-D-glucosaminyl L-malate synthase BshA
VVYNFVNCDNYKPSAAQSIRDAYAPAGERVLIHLSNFRPVKRPTDVVEIFVRVHAEIPSVLLMVGDGPERSRAEWLAHHYGVAGNVRFLGKRDNINELIGTSDLLLLPSETESFGLVALEAMACEVPVVVSRVGGLPEVVTDGREGFLVEVHDVEKMAERAIEILSDDELRDRMGKLGRRTAKARFCADEIVEEYERFYEKVLSRS